MHRCKRLVQRLCKKGAPRRSPLRSGLGLGTRVAVERSCRPSPCDRGREHMEPTPRSAPRWPGSIPTSPPISRAPTPTPWVILIYSLGAARCRLGLRACQEAGWVRSGCVARRSATPHHASAAVPLEVPSCCALSETREPPLMQAGTSASEDRERPLHDRRTGRHVHGKEPRHGRPDRYASTAAPWWGAWGLKSVGPTCSGPRPLPTPLAQFLG